VVVIAHSMGSLVARSWLGPLEGWPQCQALCRFPVPASNGTAVTAGLRRFTLESQSCVAAPMSSNSVARSCDCLAHRFGNAGDRADREPRYPSDMSDAEWAVVRDALPVPAWLEGRGGRPEGYCHRQMRDAVRYTVDNGIKWRAMPVDFPARDRVYAFARRWGATGLLAELPDRLRGQVREDAGRAPEPTAGIIDLVWADGGYTGALVAWAMQKLQLTAQVVKAPREAGY
jgi:transposase